MPRFNAVCPGCRKKFPWNPMNGLPTRCPLPGCDYSSEEKEVIEISAPFIRSARMKATDDCYRQLEQQSEMRAYMAAEASGVPVSEMSHLKVTNIKDNTREGEIAAMPVVNDVTRQMDMLRARGQPVGFGGQMDARTLAAESSSGAITINGQVTKGIVPRAGTNAMQSVQNAIVSSFGGRGYSTKSA